VARTLARAAPWTALGALSLALCFGWAWSRLEVDTDPLGILPADHPFRLATDAIGERLGGTETFELLLEPPGPPLAQFRLLELETRLLGLEGVAGPAGVPRRSEDGSALVSMLLEPAGTTARETLFASAEELARQLGWGSAHATGLAVRIARDSGALARGEAWGMLTSLLTLLPCVVILRSARLTLVGLLANALPCLLLHGGLALAGRPLSVASAMIGSVILGLVVDDAIFLLHGYRIHGGARSARSTVARTLADRAQAMTVTTLVLALGFLSSLAGRLATTREFGVLASGSIVAAWAANLFLVPSFLLLGRRLRAGATVRRRRASREAV
jgi:predicted RND superfamily exporter protein